jgi:hypothetical protein
MTFQNLVAGVWAMCDERLDDRDGVNSGSGSVGGVPEPTDKSWRGTTSLKG